MVGLQYLSSCRWKPWPSEVGSENKRGSYPKSLQSRYNFTLLSITSDQSSKCIEEESQRTKNAHVEVKREDAYIGWLVGRECFASLTYSILLASKNEWVAQNVIPYTLSTHGQLCDVRVLQNLPLGPPYLL